MLKIGVTGGIGSGKSLVAQMFAILGAPVFDADLEAKAIMVKDESVKRQIRELFGAESYLGDKLNRQYLASIVFKDAYKLELLNAIVHPATISRAEEWFKQHDAAYAVKEAALLFEAGTSQGLDFIVGVTAPKHMRIQRAMKRDGLTREDVIARMERQVDEELKMKLCDYVIINDEQRSIIEQVLALHKRFVAKAEYKGGK